MKTKTLDIDIANVKELDGGTHQFEGYASKFGGVDDYGDSIVKGAYLKTLSNRRRPVQMLKGHNRSIVIGKWLDIREDDNGLYVKGELTPGHSLSEDVYASLKHGAINGLSIGYRVVDSEVRDQITYLKEIDLIEISIVNNPADLQAEVSDVKEFEDDLEDIEDIKSLEQFFRDRFDLSQKQSKALVSRAKGVFGHRDDGSDDDGQRDAESSKTSLESALISHFRAK